MGTRLARAALGIGIAAAALVLGTPAAGAAPLTFRGAGYVLRGPNQLTMTFRIPAVTCGSHADSRDLDIGAFSSDTSYVWDAAASMSCFAGAPRTQLYLVAGSGGQNGAVIDGSGDVIEVVLSGLDSANPVAEIRDRDVPHSRLTTGLGAAVNEVAVGALAYRPLRFPTFSSHVSVDNGLPFLKVPHTHQDEVRHGVTLIKVGAAPVQGDRFPLIYRHR